jgi:hypothetical protein
MHKYQGKYVPNIKPVYEYGSIENFWSGHDLDDWVKKFTMIESIKQDSLEKGRGDFAGINSLDVRYKWFDVKIFSKIKDVFGDIKLIFAAFANADAPFPIHLDYWSDKIPEEGKSPYYSFVIPYSVDNDKTLVEESSTMVFDDKPSNDWKDLHDQYLTHHKVEDIKKYTLLKNNHWKKDLLIYWHSSLNHSSSNFRNNHTSKQMFVIHTYK